MAEQYLLNKNSSCYGIDSREVNSYRNVVRQTLLAYKGKAGQVEWVVYQIICYHT